MTTTHEAHMTYIVAIDVGGTFTDGVAIDLRSGAVSSAKSPTTYPDPFDGVMRALDELASAHRLDRGRLLAETRKLVHATTLTSNVVLERSGAKVGLLATRGFGDAILMMSGKGRVAGLSLMERRHFRATDKPDPIVPRHRVVEVSERTDVDGDHVVPLTDDEIERACEQVAALELDACAVALLWSFRNPQHEQRLADALRARVPEMFVSTSSELAPLLGEYERTATAVVNCYVGPAVKGYLETVEQALGDAGLRVPLMIVQSSGGVAFAAETHPVNTLESGPAAGVRASGHLLEQLGLDHAIATDVGGTTFKVAIIRDRDPGLTNETVLGQYSLLIPMTDVVSIGAGGGSIAWADGNRLRVGPQSAGSDPGPACYGWGGTEPTVTDADVVLGYLNPDYFLGGQMQLDLDAAWRAVEQRVARPLFAGDTLAAAAGIREVVNTQMADLIRKASLERGHDPRDFVVLAYGGAGPLHCATFAAELGCRQIVVPPNATVYSAFGAAVSNLLHSHSRARQGPAPGDACVVRRDLEELEATARATLAREGVAPADMTFAPWVEMRYRRQFFELRMPLSAIEEIDAAAMAGVLRDFERAYAQRYGAGAGHGEERVEYVRFGLDASGAMVAPPQVPQPLRPSNSASAIKGERAVHWRDIGVFPATPVYDGAALRPGDVIEGPGIIEHVGTSIAIHQDQTGEIDQYLNTVIHLGEGSDEHRRPSQL
jgi:N-methylhydantoinase A